MSKESPATVALHPSASTVVRFGPFRFDRANRILSRGESEITLPPRVLGVLEFLLERQGKVVSKRELLDGVWDEAHVTETSLTEAVSLLRQALQDDVQRPAYIQTVHRRGYRFIARVRVDATPELGRRDIAAPGSAAAPHATAVARSFLAAAAPALAWAFGALALVAIAYWLGRSTRVPARPESGPAVTRFAMQLPAGDKLRWHIPSLALSPDGRELVYTAERNGELRLFHRSLGSFQTRELQGSEGGFAPFFSPDGRWVGFFTEQELHKLPLGGGPALSLCRVLKAYGGTWGRDGSIVFASEVPRGLFRVSAAGGPVERLTTPDAAAGELHHGWPQFLPDGRHVLFSVWTNSFQADRAELVEVSSGERRILIEDAAATRYSPTGHLLFTRSGTLLAAPFDVEQGRLVGSAAVVVSEVGLHPFLGLVQMAVGGDTLAYILGPAQPGGRELAAWSEDEPPRALPASTRLYRNLAPAPDGERLAVTVVDGERSDVWVARRSDGGLTRLTFEGFNIEPVWTGDGAWVSFASNRQGPFNIYRKRADGAGRVERLWESQHHQYPECWSADGHELVFSEIHPETGFDIWVLRTAADGWTAEPLLVGADHETWAALSPDGRWLAYASTASGRWEIYLQSYPEADAKWQISLDGGETPMWSRDGRELYYFSGHRLLAVPLEFEPEFRAGPERLLAEGDDLVLARPAAEGTWFAIRERSDIPQPESIRVVLHWTGSLETSALQAR